MMTNTNDHRNIYLKDLSVSELIYFGQLIKQNKENQTSAIKRRTRLAWTNF